jgi:hypothetical protein
VFEFINEDKLERSYIRHNWRAFENAFAIHDIHDITDYRYKLRSALVETADYLLGKDKDSDFIVLDHYMPYVDNYGLGLTLLLFLSYVYPIFNEASRESLIDGLRSRLSNKGKPYTTEELEAILTALLATADVLKRISSLELSKRPSPADAAREMDQGISACLFYGDDAQKVHETLSAEGWEGDVDNEAGIGYIYPNGSEATVVTVGMDGTWCNVESFVQSSEKSAMQLLAYLEGPESPFEVSYDKSEMGCTQFGIGDGWAVSILSGGQDPICGAEDNSAVRVEYITQ